MGPAQVLRVEAGVQHRLGVVSLDGLVDSSGRVLDEFALDGVHLAPAAVRFLERALCGRPDMQATDR